MELDVGKDIVCLAVTCSKDKTRAEIFQLVSNTIKEIPSQNLIAFDNASTFDITIKEIAKLTPHSFKSNVNYGFWSAINWTLENYERLVGEKKYIYVIESDAVHDKGCWNALKKSALYLNANENIGSVRLQELKVEEVHLYDKNHPRNDSRKWAWSRMSNHWTQEKAYFHHCENEFYTTNLVPQVCSLNRLDFMKYAFSKLKSIGKFTEMDFQKSYFDMYKETCIYNGGIFNTKISYESDALKGSWLSEADRKNSDYKPTREDEIKIIEETNLSLCCKC